MSEPRKKETVEFTGRSAASGACPQPLSVDPQVDVAGLSHQGKVRPSNQDHFLIARFGRFLENVRTSLPAKELPPRCEETGYAMIVADGMGGHAAGETASRLAIHALFDLAVSTPDWILRLDDDAYRQEAMRRARERTGLINAALVEQAHANPALSGFGTTMTVARSMGNDLLLSHIGDSRAYLLRSGKLHQLTHDHTVAQALADGGVITQGEAATHPARHILTNVLGDRPGAVRPDVRQVALQHDDCLLLCTDGLTNMVDEKSIAAAFANGDAAETICRRLVDQALAAGGKDNVTVIVARYGFAEKS